jgi:hypothetical protein
VASKATAFTAWLYPKKVGVGGVEPPFFRLSIEHSTFKLHPYQKFVQKKFKTLRVSILEYQSFLILMGFMKVNATNQMLVKNFLDGLFELLRLYFLIRKRKKKKLCVLTRRRPNFFFLFVTTARDLKKKTGFNCFFFLFLFGKGILIDLNTNLLKKKKYL